MNCQLWSLVARQIQTEVFEELVLDYFWVAVSMDYLCELLENEFDQLVVHFLFVNKPSFGMIVDLDEDLSSFDPSLSFLDIHRL